MGGSWLQAVLLIFGICWCYRVIHHLPNDILVFRQSDDIIRRPAVLIIWSVTPLIAILMIWSFIILISRIADSISAFRLV